jgi:hypothetical protein
LLTSKNKAPINASNKQPNFLKLVLIFFAASFEICKSLGTDLINTYPNGVIPSKDFIKFFN